MFFVLQSHDRCKQCRIRRECPEQQYPLVRIVIGLRINDTSTNRAVLMLANAFDGRFLHLEKLILMPFLELLLTTHERETLPTLLKGRTQGQSLTGRDSWLPSQFQENA